MHPAFIGTAGECDACGGSCLVFDTPDHKYTLCPSCSSTYMCSHDISMLGWWKPGKIQSALFAPNCDINCRFVYGAPMSTRSYIVHSGSCRCAGDGIMQTIFDEKRLWEIEVVREKLPRGVQPLADWLSRRREPLVTNRKGAYCDCGAERAKTTHAHWCSSYKNGNAI